MAKISIYLDDKLLEELDDLVKHSQDLTKRSRSALCSYLIEQEAAKQKHQRMLEAARIVDELGLGWSEEE